MGIKRMRLSEFRYIRNTRVQKDRGACFEDDL